MIDDLPVIFPYDYIYPEQYEYMCDLKRSLDCKGHCLLEMPSGTGKTVSLLSLIISYQLHYPETRKLVYCSRTVPEIDKALMELKRLMEYRQAHGANDPSFIGLGLTSRKNLCLNPDVNKHREGRIVDAKCRDRTASWNRRNILEQTTAATPNNDDDGDEIELCPFYETLETSSKETSMPLPSGVYTMDDLKDFGQKMTYCPYYLARRMIPFANVIIYSYHYMLDPKVADLVSKEFSKDTIVVFDEAHNIDSTCFEALSVDLNTNVLEASSRSIKKLSQRVEQIKQEDSQKLKDEYEKLVEGLRMTTEARDEDLILANPILPDDLLKEAVPGNIRQAQHFVQFLNRLIEYLRARMRVRHVVAETPTSFLHHLREITYIDAKPLRFSAERLSSLVRTLELTDLEDYWALSRVASFATICSTYEKGFMVLFEPYENDTDKSPNPILHLTCLDPSIVVQPVFNRFSTVVVTSGTLSPLDMYPRMLKIYPVIQKSYTMSLTRSCFLPMVITRGSDQVAMSSKFEVRSDPAVVRNFGNLLIECARVVPDGVVAFFPSYLYMESIVAMWNEMGVLRDVWKHKLIFVETPDAAETSVALANYRAACCNGRGAVLLSVARGKVSEGIDFDHNYGRAVVMFGIPYQYTESRILRARLEYLREECEIRENDFLTFDAMRHAAQCMGRVLRGKTDYGLMVLADKRYGRADKLSKLPKWIQNCVSETATNLSTDMGVSMMKRFLKSMAQPFDQIGQLGVSLWSLKDIETHQKGKNATAATQKVAANTNGSSAVVPSG
ncbi:TFIIH/NER complex ATP-dependent 5'-3' DNA helicase subunit [Mycoemilia scoparia]|uniref:DNA 5'-3' helicase n=1 Tax=Mycoemilia scoparia TaxID=417184 RepID=A0A9W8A167_9FUNG|nr:TFIIH/NER complex ATP-dependent 5'-3' DNA helicase subunit [Mycoemilia scoparia]